MYRTNQPQNMDQIFETNEPFDIVPKMRPKKAYIPKKQVIEAGYVQTVKH